MNARVLFLSSMFFRRGNGATGQGANPHRRRLGELYLGGRCRPRTQDHSVFYHRPVTLTPRSPVLIVVPAQVETAGRTGTPG